MNRVVYDCVDAAPSQFSNNAQQEETAELSNEPVATGKQEPDNAAEDPNFCDNDQVMSPYYQPSFKNDHTLVFESRFESGNLRRAI